MYDRVNEEAVELKLQVLDYLKVASLDPNNIHDVAQVVVQGFGHGPDCDDFVATKLSHVVMRTLFEEMDLKTVRFPLADLLLMSALDQVENKLAFITLIGVVMDPILDNPDFMAPLIEHHVRHQSS